MAVLKAIQVAALVTISFWLAIIAAMQFQTRTAHMTCIGDRAVFTTTGGGAAVAPYDAECIQRRMGTK